MLDDHERDGLTSRRGSHVYEHVNEPTRADRAPVSATRRSVIMRYQIISRRSHTSPDIGWMRFVRLGVARSLCWLLYWV